jgi:hypothetical protein
VENLKADTGQGVNIEERLVLSGIGCEDHHAALCRLSKGQAAKVLGGLGCLAAGCKEYPLF